MHWSWIHFFVLATGVIYNIHLSYGWKPIVGGSITTSFNLQQSHPGSATSAKTLTLGSSSVESSEYSSSPLLPQKSASKVLSGVSDAIAISAPLTGLPGSHTGLKFETDEFEYERDLFGGGDFGEVIRTVQRMLQLDFFYNFNISMVFVFSLVIDENRITAL